RARTPVEVARRAEAAFAAPVVGARVDQVVHVLPKARRAREVYDAYATPKAARCLAGVVGVPVTVDKTGRVGDESITYRAAAARNLVIRVVRTGPTVTALTFANAVTPPPPEAVTAITNAAIAR